MRRKDREVTDHEEVLAILQRCQVIHVAMQGNEYPYVVPVSFGMEIVNDMPVLWFHSAKQGRKAELLAAHPEVCVEAENFFRIQKTAHGITSRYESVIGFGKCEAAETQEEVIHGLRLLLEHYGETDYPLDRCRGIVNVKMYRITLDSITGKANPVE